MLRHQDPEVQFLVETLEGQRDQAVSQAAALFRTVKQLEARIEELEHDQAEAKSGSFVEGKQFGMTD